MGQLGLFRVFLRPNSYLIAFAIVVGAGAVPLVVRLGLANGS